MRLLNVTPIDSVDYAPNTPLGNTVSLTDGRKAFACFPSFAYVPNLVRRKAGVGVFLAPENQFRMLPISRTTLLRHIFHIVGMSAEEKMVGVDTRRVVTFMQNVKFFGKLTISNTISPSVSVFIGTVVEGENTVAIRIGRTKPQPALIGFAPFHFTPKLIGQGFYRFLCAMPHAKPQVIPSLISALRVRSGGYGGFFPTPTLAKFRAFKTKLYRGFVEWYTHSIKSPVMRFGHAEDVCASLGLSVGTIIPQNMAV